MSGMVSYLLDKIPMFKILTAIPVHEQITDQTFFITRRMEY